MFTRRQFIRLTLSGIAASPLAGRLADPFAYAEMLVSPRGTAKTCILIFMIGGPSQLETWDAKEGPWTPANLDIRSYPGGLNLSYTLFPMLSRKSGR